ncbi:hypothetical protein SAMN00777080_2540 [Aquiflexum balticum DSM 16537]|uniref:Uncharacterized protein n=1 Tax=Aquiflexum balticum DSM 16537 TaxID=758820 RepID=A0A1W2H4Q1_9BACT|nr:hypothetical protein [Aquiflexum balticum]SMD43927.1 hypothetical protein SAMN00777080_2540 [Aquiflexum balticum DSM 16537]
MNIVELQLKLHQAIDSITDRSTLEVLNKLLSSDKGPFAKMSLKEYNDAIEKSLQQIKEGEFVSVEDLEKESDIW